MFFLLLVRQSGQTAGNFAYLNVPEWQSELADMMIEKCSVQRLVLMPLDDRVDDELRQSFKVSLGPGLEGQQLVKL